MEKSSVSDQVSIYRRSCAIQCENAVLLRPFTCHKQVRPGFTLKRRIRDGSSNRETSRLGSGRGPTRDMSPRSTLRNWGSSSSDVFRNSRPMAVILGSLRILNTGPFASFRDSSPACSVSASGTIVRNLYMRNRRLCNP